MPDRGGTILKSAKQGATLVLTLNRPEKRNALDPVLIKELSDAFTQADGDQSVAAIILTGAGTSFCAGLDLTHLLKSSPDEKVAYMKSFFELLRRIYTVKQPVIAAINGPAMAGGFDLAAASDIRLCSPEAQFAQTEILLGITQIMYPIYEAIGLGHAKELALTGDAISAPEAYRIGLVNRICALDLLLDDAIRLGERLAARPRQALFETKRLSRELIDLNTESAMTLMFERISERLRSDEHRVQAEQYVARLHRQHADR